MADRGSRTRQAPQHAAVPRSPGEHVGGHLARQRAERNPERRRARLVANSHVRKPSEALNGSTQSTRSNWQSRDSTRTMSWFRTRMPSNLQRFEQLAQEHRGDENRRRRPLSATSHPRSWHTEPLRARSPPTRCIRVLDVLTSAAVSPATPAPTTATGGVADIRVSISLETRRFRDCTVRVQVGQRARRPWTDRAMCPKARMFDDRERGNLALRAGTCAVATRSPLASVPRDGARVRTDAYARVARSGSSTIPANAAAAGCSRGGAATPW